MSPWQKLQGQKTLIFFLPLLDEPPQNIVNLCLWRQRPNKRSIRGLNSIEDGQRVELKTLIRSRSWSIIQKMLQPIPRFTIVSKSLHSALNWLEDTVDRLTDENNKNRVMSRGQYENLCSSIENIHEYIKETVGSDNTRDILGGLEKLFNGGHISNYQYKSYIARYKLASG